MGTGGYLFDRRVNVTGAMNCYVVVSEKSDGGEYPFRRNEGVFATEKAAKEFILRWMANTEDCDGEELFIEPWVIQ